MAPSNVNKRATKTPAKAKSPPPPTSSNKVRSKLYSVAENRIQSPAPPPQAAPPQAAPPQAAPPQAAPLMSPGGGESAAPLSALADAAAAAPAIPPCQGIRTGRVQNWGSLHVPFMCQNFQWMHGNWHGKNCRGMVNNPVLSTTCSTSCLTAGKNISRKHHPYLFGATSLDALKARVLPSATTLEGEIRLLLTDSLVLPTLVPNYRDQLQFLCWAMMLVDNEWPGIVVNHMHVRLCEAPTKSPQCHCFVLVEVDSMIRKWECLECKKLDANLQLQQKRKVAREIREAEQKKNNKRGRKKES